MYYDRDKVQVGGVLRYRIEIPNDQAVYVKLKNNEFTAMRAAYVNGPFTLYCDMCPINYTDTSCPTAATTPIYENHVKAGSEFDFEINSTTQCRIFDVTIMPEILFSKTAEINFSFTVTDCLDKLNHTEFDEECTAVKITKMSTQDIWEPQYDPQKPLHVCVLTHGLVSNVTCDLLYVKESIDRKAKETGQNLICVGFTKNACETERGVKHLGRKIANWLIDDIIPKYKPAKMSFIAHSLGGLTQTYALGYVQFTHPELFSNIEFENYVCLASPMLGVANENPGYVQFALDFGVVGKTGRDLGLSWAPTSKPLLEELPNENTCAILRKFKNRTLYANAVNDGIVPLRTSSLLFLDWCALAEANNNSAPKSKAWAFCDIFVHRNSLRAIKRSQINSELNSKHLVVESLPHKTTLLENGVTLLNPPHPTKEFLNNPESRRKVIFHDRVYNEFELPPKRYKTRIHLCKGVKEVVENSRPEELIARQYHSKMSWRKVLVKLEPEAHNNIIVRRKFSNAYGWPVISHLVSEHFSNSNSHSENTKDAANPVIVDDAIEMRGNPIWSSDHEEELEVPSYVYYM